MSKGFMGMLESAGLVEDDASVVPPPPSRQQSAAAPVYPAVGQPAPASFTPNYSAAPGSPVLDQADQDRLHAIEQQVYQTPSTYVLFRDFRSAMGNPNDANQILKLLSAANPGVTKAKILSDIDTHLAVIASQSTSFEQSLQQARSTRIEGPSQQIASLTEANQRATQEIAARTQQIQQLQVGVQEATRAIGEGQQKFSLVITTLQQPLLQAKQLLS